jgi:hypothetical protein
VLIIAVRVINRSDIRWLLLRSESGRVQGVG